MGRYAVHLNDPSLFAAFPFGRPYRHPGPQCPGAASGGSHQRASVPGDSPPPRWQRRLPQAAAAPAWPAHAQQPALRQAAGLPHRPMSLLRAGGWEQAVWAAQRFSRGRTSLVGRENSALFSLKMGWQEWLCSPKQNVLREGEKLINVSKEEDRKKKKNDDCIVVSAGRRHKCRSHLQTSFFSRLLQISLTPWGTACMIRHWTLWWQNHLKLSLMGWC